jgi:hypothetical protein
MGTAEVQGALWGAAARDWSELNEPHCAALYEAVFDAIGVDGSTELLDAGCGAGLALQIAAKRGAASPASTPPRRCWRSRPNVSPAPTCAGATWSRFPTATARSAR